MTTIPPDTTVVDSTTTPVVDSATATTATTAPTAQPCDNGSYVYGYNDNGSPLFVICGPATVAVEPPPPANYDRCLNGYTAFTFQPCADTQLSPLSASATQPVTEGAPTHASTLASRTLPATGNASAPLVGGGFAALALGVAMLFGSRRVGVR